MIQWMMANMAEEKKEGRAGHTSSTITQKIINLILDFEKSVC